MSFHFDSEKTSWLGRLSMVCIVVLFAVWLLYLPLYAIFAIVSRGWQ